MVSPEKCPKNGGREKAGEQKVKVPPKKGKGDGSKKVNKGKGKGKGKNKGKGKKSMKDTKKLAKEKKKEQRPKEKGRTKRKGNHATRHLSFGFGVICLHFYWFAATHSVIFYVRLMLA